MSLESFPFDIDVIECNFMCTGDWRCDRLPPPPPPPPPMPPPRPPMPPLAVVAVVAARGRASAPLPREAVTEAAAVTATLQFGGPGDRRQCGGVVRLLLPPRAVQDGPAAVRHPGVVQGARVELTRARPCMHIPPPPTLHDSAHTPAANGSAHPPPPTLPCPDALIGFVACMRHESRETTNSTHGSP